jgi:hypothetical protein
MDSEESPIVNYSTSEVKKHHNKESISIYHYVVYSSIIIIFIGIIYNSYICFCDNQNTKYIEDEDNKYETFVEDFVEDLKKTQDKNISQ